MKMLALLLPLSLGSTNCAGSEDVTLHHKPNYTQVSIHGTGLVVYNSGINEHNGVRIVLSFNQGGKGSLTFSASRLNEHPDLIIPRFSSDIELFDHFEYLPLNEEVSFLTAYLRMSRSERQPRMVSIGPIRNEDVEVLNAFLVSHGLELRKVAAAAR